MPFFIGLILIPIIFLIIKKSNDVKTTRKNRILLNILLLVIAVLYILFCFVVNMEPFKFEITYSVEYMIFRGDYLLNAGIIFFFTPFIWIIVVHYIRMLYKKINVRKKSTLKGDEEFIYYRGDLDKVSPSLIMFTSLLELDMKKAISSTILKLKLNGYIEEKEGGFVFTNKDEAVLLDSERMILKLIRNEKFDEKDYLKKVEEETLKNKYIIKKRGGIFGSILRIIIAIIIPVVSMMFSSFLDQYTLDNYHIWPEKDNHAYLKVELKNDIQKLQKEVKDEKDFYASILMVNGKETISYNPTYIRADKLQYSVVRKALFLNCLTAVLVGFEIVFWLIAAYLIIEEIKYIKKGYRVTLKGKELLNKAYALKNYLKKYSLIGKRTEKELVLWEYYLVYATLLDLNVNIEDEVIKKYV